MESQEAKEDYFPSHRMLTKVSQEEAKEARDLKTFYVEKEEGLKHPLLMTRGVSKYYCVSPCT